MEVSMKYRIRTDLSFDSQADAQALMDHARTLSGKAVKIGRAHV